jgi:hypothetical protein
MGSTFSLPNTTVEKRDVPQPRRTREERGEKKTRDVIRHSTKALEPSESDGGTRRIPVASIRTDESRFQNREAAFSQASVERIVKNFDARKLDPIVVWRDGAGRIYVLSGHSRLEAHRQLDLPTIPVRFFDGTESEAIQFARVEANRGATAESLTEDIRAFRAQRDGADGIPKLTKQALRDQWGAEASRLDAYTYLSAQGKFIRNLALPKNQREQFPFLEQAAQWVGELRKAYSQLTNEHENELFDFLQNNRRGVGLTRDEFFRRVEKKVSSLTFDPERALGMSVATTEEEARADTGPAERRRQQVELELERLGELFRAARTSGEKAQLRGEFEQLQAERDRLRRDIAVVLRTQQGLFGKRLRPSTQAIPQTYVFQVGRLPMKSGPDRYTYFGNVPEIFFYEVPATTSDILGNNTHKNDKGETVTFRLPSFDTMQEAEQYAIERGHIPYGAQPKQPAKQNVSPGTQHALFGKRKKKTRR